MAVPEEERRARSVLLRAAEPGNRALLDAVRRAGAVEVADRIRRGRPLEGLDVDGMRLRLREGQAERDLERAAECGARLVVPGDPDWPARLNDLDRFAAGCLGLYVRGRLADLDLGCDRSVAVVGTRAASGYGEWVARELATALAGRGWVVVSGLAFGIDAAAHRGALRAPDGAGTVAVLASGVDRAYPQAHAALCEEIALTGAVVSESPPGCAPLRHRFLARNRLIAALTRGTVVVEAGARSGARSTARHAAVLGRAVMAVPGPVSSLASVGCHQLLRDDPAAVLITCADEVVEMVGEIGDLAERPQGAVTARDRLDRLDSLVLEAVPVRRPAGLERIAVTAGVAPTRVAECLARLAGAGLIRHGNDGWVLSDAARSDRPEPAEPLDWWEAH